MDAFISTLQSPWAVVIALAVAVLIGVVIRLAVSSRRRSGQDVTPQPQAQAPVEALPDTPAEASLDDADQARWVVRFSAFSAAASSVPPTGRRSRSLSSSLTSALRPPTR